MMLYCVWCDFSAVHWLIKLKVNLTNIMISPPPSNFTDQSRILWKILLAKRIVYNPGILQQRRVTQITLQGNFIEKLSS